jgi:hypothetical protein
MLWAGNDLAGPHVLSICVSDAGRNGLHATAESFFAGVNV